jgi:hypothetical protein
MLEVAKQSSNFRWTTHDLIAQRIHPPSCLRGLTDQGGRGMLNRNILLGFCVYQQEILWMYTEVADTSATIPGKFKPDWLGAGSSQVSGRRQQLLQVPAQSTKMRQRLELHWIGGHICRYVPRTRNHYIAPGGNQCISWKLAMLTKVPECENSSNNQPHTQ